MEGLHSEKSTKERTLEFKRWMEKRIEAVETMLCADMYLLDSYLDRKKFLDEGLFNKGFRDDYYFINNGIKEAVWRADHFNIPENVLDEVVDIFKQNKRKIRNAKMEYKKAFKDLEEQASKDICS
jgi:hypothetical protein